MRNAAYTLAGIRPPWANVYDTKKPSVERRMYRCSVRVDAPWLPSFASLRDLGRDGWLSEHLVWLCQPDLPFWCIPLCTVA